MSIEIYAKISFLIPMNGGRLSKNALVALIRGIDVTATQSALNPADAAQIFLHQ